MLVLLAVLLWPQPGFAQLFKLGSINFYPAAETRKFWPLASYLARQLRPDGIDDGKVVVAESIPIMASLMRTGQVDVYIDSVFPTLAVSRLSGSMLLLRRWKMGKSEYRSVIFTRDDSGIARLEDLKGKVIALEEPFGSSGYFFPKLVLLEKGFRLAFKRHGSDPVKPDEVAYIFSRNDANTVRLVFNATVAAGATDDQKFLTLAKNLNSLKIIHETASFPRQIVSHRKDLPAKLAARVKEVLLNMTQTEEGRQALQAFEGTTKFDEIPVRDRDFMASLQKQVDAELKIQH